MSKTITVELRPEDAERYLREAAFEAARYGAWCDHITGRTYNGPSRGGETLIEAKKRWLEKFLRAKRIVEAFGVEYEPTSEEETLGVHIPMKNEKRKLVKIAGMAFNEVSGGVPDYKNPMPSYRGGVHEEACRAAAVRVVRHWRETINYAKAA